MKKRSTEDGSICPGCGMNIMPGSSFCPNCGKKQEVTEHKQEVTEQKTVTVDQTKVCPPGEAHNALVLGIAGAVLVVVGLIQFYAAFTIFGSILNLFFGGVGIVIGIVLIVQTFQALSTPVNAG